METTKSQADHPKPRRWLRRVGWVVVWMVTLVALAYALENWRGKRAWKRTVEQLHSRGIPYEFKQLVPKPVPDGENFGALPVVVDWFKQKEGESTAPASLDLIDEAQSHLDAPKTKKKQPKPRVAIDLIALEQALEFMKKAPGQPGQIPSTPAEANTPEARARAARTIMAELAKSEAYLVQIREGLKRPYIQFPLNYSEAVPFAMKLPHLAKLRSYSYRLQLRASAALALGNPQEAARDIEMIMKLAETIKTEPLLISHLVRVAMLNMAIQPVWEGLQQRAWSERELTILQEVFDRPDLVREFRNAWVGERACALSALDYCRKQGSLNVLNPDMVPVTAADRGGDLSRLIPTGWYLQEMANYSRAMDKYLSTVDYDNNRFYPERVKEFESDFLHKRGVLSAARVLWNHELAVQLIMPSMPRVCYSFAAAKAGVDQTVLVCALEQARLREGTYPATLDSIKASLGDLPRDPVSGEHYVYRPESGGYKLYSTGWDGDDDQGTPLPPGDAEGSGDWVWGFVLR